MKYRNLGAYFIADKNFTIIIARKPKRRYNTIILYHNKKRRKTNARH